MSLEEPDNIPEGARYLSASPPHPIHQYSSALNTVLPSISSSVTSTPSKFQEQLEKMAANNRTLEGLAVLALDQEPLCIKYPQLDATIELKSGMIHLLSTFHRFAGEDPNKHLKEFHDVSVAARVDHVLLVGNFGDL
ncbi:hypothetical protein TorRG33x02_334180 [Trema orientale]|uniref:Uncharacterized protein n=1 Tax=Trema orientale TaxID=63057 RepID=A0A2P5B326_TREOI|nr:hypothetical protein TorRG33x02_334180 [Trema orientale]